ncbi:GNAT family N-acetyltransferase [Sinorhizobium sp. BJ1]|uniref:GNAT family N-acetyltransferase n=1 Tax=Sinorhizobium sp. BJ1 TaxID=2035455 RepID=UPI000BE7EC58|nr:GNAT family N-acetyltransferase [Sinorhizobium sp. BJ1]PDT83166.1 GNAT family N-acetyltransferase [Sinorhizobium sp. BJ1]
MGIELPKIVLHPATVVEPQCPGTRALARSDIPAIGRLFNKVFRRRDSAAGEDLDRYMETVFFGSPFYSPEQGGVVHENGNGDIDSAILSVPMEFDVDGRRIVARLLCAFMVDGKAAAAGAARLARGVRAARQDLCFSDSSSPVSADHCVAGGGVILPIQSLEWQRFLRPLAAVAILAGRRIPMLKARLVVGALRSIDRVLRRWSPSTRPLGAPGCHVQAASLDEFLRCAAPMLERFSIRPAWSKSEFDWLVNIASMNKSLGVLQSRNVIRDDGRTIGAFLFFGKPGGMANVLNVLCEEGCEADVTAAMFACLDAEGYAVATGMAQPFLMNAISRQRWLCFRHRGYFCLVTRHADIKEAALGNDIYIGGLASESWSRLLTDF